MLCSGRDSIQKIPVTRFDVDALDGTDAKLYVKRGHFVQGIEQFDNAFFGMGSAEAGAIDPHHRLLLEVGYSALHDGGYESKGDLMGANVGVFLGFATSSEWGFIQSGRQTRSTPFSNHGSDPSAACGRMSYLLGLKGPCFPVNTACSSTLVALDAACHSET